MPPALDAAKVRHLARLASRLDGANPGLWEEDLTEFDRVTGTALPIEHFQGIYGAEEQSRFPLPAGLSHKFGHGASPSRAGAGHPFSRARRPITVSGCGHRHSPELTPTFRKGSAILRQSAEVPPMLEWFCCPDCHSELAPGQAVVTCTTCGRTANRLAPNLFGFRPGDEAVARAILGWPTEFVRKLDKWARNGGTGVDLAGDFREQLARHGLTRPDGSLTPLGDEVRYHVSEYDWQAGRKGLDGVLDLGEIGDRVRMLDVGCGAAQTLRRIEPDRRVDLAGVDTSPTALALGCRFARLQDLPIALGLATAYALPFRDGSFDLVLTRVALNYMHQRKALTEMARVLRPGGFLFCRVEGIRHDYSLLCSARSFRGLACRCRDFGYGMIHSLTGWQMTPGSLLRGGRAFATAGRIARIMESLNCHVLRMTESPNGPKVLGHRTQFIVVGRIR